MNDISWTYRLNCNPASVIIISGKIQPVVFIQVTELGAKMVAYNLEALCIVMRGVFQLNDPPKQWQALEQAATK